MDFETLTQKALAVTNPRQLEEFAYVGVVGAAILTQDGNVYVGANMDLACGVGFCAEHAAVAAMLTAGEHIIKKVVAVGHKGNIMPPCGRCRELMSQLSRQNLQAEVLVAPGKTVLLSELLPYDWK